MVCSSSFPVLKLCETESFEEEEKLKLCQNIHMGIDGHFSFVSNSWLYKTRPTKYFNRKASLVTYNVFFITVGELF
jgi:hypothetical protein